MIARGDIVRAALACVGTRYRHQGRVRGVALDCVGLIGCVGAAIGAPNAKQWHADPDMHNYPRIPHDETLVAATMRYLDPVRPRSAAQLGDVLLFSVGGHRRHFAIVTRIEPIYVVHAYALLAARGVVEQSLPIAKAEWADTFSFRGVEA